MLIHSGRQFGGLPIKSGRQEHDGESFISLHWALGPQGDGWHGLILTGSSCAKIVMYLKTFLIINQVLRLGKHLIKGSPICCGGQLQIGL